MSGGREHRERLWPSWWVWLLVAGTGSSFALVAARYSDRGAVVAGVVSAVVVGLLVLLATPEVAVTGTEVVAGRARIPLACTGEVEVLDRAAMRRATGPGSDARAYLCLRPWVGSGVRIDVDDPADPTPYWLISSRRAEELAAALHRARDRAEPA